MSNGTPPPKFKDIIIAVHGIGEQRRFSTVRSVATRLTEAATNLTQRLDAEWQARGNSIGSTNVVPLHAAAQTSMSTINNLTVSPHPDKQASDYGKETEKLLKRLKRYDHSLTVQIDQMNLAPEQKTAAKKALREITHELLRDFMRRREGVLERYESALTLIGSSVGP